MLAVQRYLRADGNSIESLERDFGIESTFNDDKSLVILNYSQINSVKTDELVMECRGLTLSIPDFNVVARAFPRFFNYGECLQLHEQFNWDNFVVEEKVDGSLMLIYFHNGEWCVNTRGSFAKGIVEAKLSPKTWEEFFWECVDREKVNNLLEPGKTLVFEFKSIYNKVVITHKVPHVTLLGIFPNSVQGECTRSYCDMIAERLGVSRPSYFSFKNIDEIVKYVNEQEGHLFEGVVLKDINGMRIKVKNLKYLALHRLKGNGNIFLAKNLLPFVLTGEASEILTYYPECAERLSAVQAVVDGLLVEAQILYAQTRNIDEQKAFALAVKDSRVASLLFRARKENREVRDILYESENFVLKHL